MTSFIHSKSGNILPSKKSQHWNTKIEESHLLSMPISKSNIDTAPVVVLDNQSSIEDGWSVVSEKLSAPVFDSLKNQFVGIVDIKHFLGYILYKMPFPPTGLEEKHNLKELELYPYAVLDKNSSIAQLLKYFNYGVHSAFIINEKKQLEMISQMSLIKWLLLNLDEIGIGSEPINKLIKDDHIHMFSKVHSIKNTQPVFEAFKVLYVNNIYGMPILDENEKIVGNISVTDLDKSDENLDRLSLPLSMYFKQRPIYTCGTETSLKKVLEMFIDNNIHRLHILDNKNQPCGIITISDIINMLFKHIDSGVLSPIPKKAAGAQM